MAQLTINYTATSDIKAYAYNQTTGAWCLANIDQNASTWDSTTKEGTLVFNEGVTELPDYTFRSAPLLTLDIQPGWTRFGNSLSTWCFIFADCVNLTSVKLPNTVTFLGGSVFSRCSRLHDVDLGSGLEKIGQYCFDWTSIEEIVFPQSLTQIAAHAFVGSTDIIKVTCKAAIPPTLGIENFQNSDDVLYVPNSSKSAYQASSAWSSAFSEIISIGEHNEIVYNATSDLKAYSYNGGTWCITNIDQNASTWDSITGDGILVLNQGVTSIGVFAFGNCTDLISISFGEDITLIDQTAFANCTNLTDIGIPATTTSIAKGYNLSFKNCQKLEYISIDDNNTVYSSYRNCIIEKATNNLILGCKNTVIPNTVVSIDDYAFNSQKGMTEIYIPEGVISIGAYTFASCTNLTNVLLPSTLSNIGNLCFNNCSAITSVVCVGSTPPTLSTNQVFPSSIYSTATLYVLPPYITDYQNSNWSNYFSTIDIYNTIRYNATMNLKSRNIWLQNNVNQNASTWDSITGDGLLVLNTGVYVISASALWNINELKSIVIPGSIIEIGNDAFGACNNLNSIILNEGLVKIGKGAFRSTKITSLNIPSTVTSFGGGMTQIPTLVSLSVDSNNTTYDSRNNCNCIIETATNNLVSGCNNSIIPSDIEIISTEAFSDTLSLTSITLPNTLTTIKTRAFIHTSITTINIPASVSTIEIQAFENDQYIESIIVDSNNTTYDSRNNCNCIIETATDKLIVGCKNSIIPNSVTSIGGYAFNYAYGLQSIEIPNSITSIERYAFYYCNNLQSIEIPNSVTSIGEYAFMYCMSLQSIEIPDSVTSIGTGAFRIVSNLKTITVDSNNTTYDSRNNCNCIIETATDKLIVGSLYSVIPDDVIVLDQYCFENNPLPQITIPASVTEIKSSAFWNNHNLSKVICLATTPPTINGSNFSLANDTLYVPIESLSAYSSSTWNSRFQNITFIPGITIHYTSNTDLTAYSNWLQNNVNTSGSSYDSTTHEGIIMLNYDVTGIGDNAFENCTDLIEIEILDNITSIGDNAFNGCDNLSSVLITNVFPCSLGENNFTADDDTLYVPSLNIEAYQNDPSWSDVFSNIEKIPGNEIFYTATRDIMLYPTIWLTNNIKYHFYNNITGEGSLILNDDVTTLGQYALTRSFSGNYPGIDELLTLTLPEAITILEHRSILNAINLVELNLPSTLTRIESSGISGLSSLTSLTIPSSVTFINSNATQGDTNLLSVTSFATTPPTLGSVNFEASNDTLYMPIASKSAYQSANEWRTAFTYYKGLCEISTSTDGNGEITESETVIEGESFTVSATPNEHYKVSHFIVDGLDVGTIDNYTFQNLDADHTVYVEFEPITHTITATAYEGGAIEPNGEVVVNYGDDAEFTITEYVGYMISDVVIDGESIGPVNTYSFEAVDTDHTIEAYFEQISLNITATASEGGTIEPNGDVSVVYGDDAEFTITPEEHYRISNVVVDGVSIGVVDTYTFEAVETDHTIEAYFELITHTITATAYEGGAIVPSGTITVNEGENQSFDIIPFEGYGILAVFIDGTQIEPVETYTFTDVEADHTIDAMFYPLRVTGFNRDEMLDIDYIIQDYLEQLKKRD